MKVFIVYVMALLLKELIGSLTETWVVVLGVIFFCYRVWNRCSVLIVSNRSVSKIFALIFQSMIFPYILNSVISCLMRIVFTTQNTWLVLYNYLSNIFLHAVSSCTFWLWIWKLSTAVNFLSYMYIKDTGLSVPLFISTVMTPCTKSIVSWTMPCTWGQHRNVYASCTLLQKRWLSGIKRNDIVEIMTQVHKIEYNCYRFAGMAIFNERYLFKDTEKLHCINKHTSSINIIMYWFLLIQSTWLHVQTWILVIFKPGH